MNTGTEMKCSQIALRTVSKPIMLIISGDTSRVIPVRKEGSITEVKVNLARRVQRKREERGPQTNDKRKQWIEIKCGWVGKSLTEFLSGSWYFPAHYRMAPTALRSYRSGVNDDDHHCLFSCQRWLQRRTDLETEFEDLTPKHIVDSLCKLKRYFECERRIWIEVLFGLYRLNRKITIRAENKV